MEAEKFVQPLVTYRPAELREGEKWRVVYYAWHPTERKLKRREIQLMYIQRVPLRRKEGKILCEKINAKLRMGWNPYLEQEAPKAFSLINEAAERYLEMSEKAEKEGVARKDTIRSYKSQLNLFLKWLKDTGQESTYCIHISQPLIREYLNYVYMLRDNGARTTNNHRSFLHTFCNWLVENQYCKVNPVKGIKPKTESRKQRTVIPPQQVLRMLKDETIPKGYRLLCQMGLYCLIRRKELTMLKVRDVRLAKKCIVVPANVSKNKEEQAVAIPDVLIHELVQHMASAKNTDHLFQATNDWRPGPDGVSPTTVSATWARIRKLY